MTAEAAPQLDLVFGLRGGRTVLTHRHVGYPFHVAAPLHGPGPEAEIIVQSVSGGLFGDDRLGQRIAAGPDAAATIRMPSAAVAHGLRGKAQARQAVSLHAADGARLVYLPRPVILLPGSGLVQCIEVTLGAGAMVMLRDGFLLHDPLGAPPALRAIESAMTIRRAAGGLIACDRMRITDAVLDAATPGVSGGYRAFGTVWLLGDMTAAAYARHRMALSPIFAQAGIYGAMTPLRAGSGALIRIAARDGGDLDEALTAIAQTAPETSAAGASRPPALLATLCSNNSRGWGIDSERGA